jgi:hypothetical protein
MAKDGFDEAMDHAEGGRFVHCAKNAESSWLSHRLAALRESSVQRKPRIGDKIF